MAEKEGSNGRVGVGKRDPVGVDLSKIGKKRLARGLLGIGESQGG